MGLLVLVWRPAHPRVGGEDAMQTPEVFTPHGSPPRRRGRQPSLAQRRLAPRLTPA